MEPQKGFLDILNIARENVRKNPDVVNADTHTIIQRYLSGIEAEVAEVRREAREGNEVYLTDELSDIAWDYAVLLALCEVHGYISGAEDVLVHGVEKYTQRTPAFLQGDAVLWEEIKLKQKETLAKRHSDKYGK